MENNLDKFFKDKLEHREFERKPAYWEAATRLIELEEKRKRRRGFFIWWFTGLLVLTMLGAWWYWSSSNSTADASLTKNPTIEQNNPVLNTEKNTVQQEPLTKENITEETSNTSTIEEISETNTTQEKINQTNNLQDSKPKQSQDKNANVVGSTTDRQDSITDKTIDSKNRNGILLEKSQTPLMESKTQNSDMEQAILEQNPAVLKTDEQIEVPVENEIKAMRIFAVTALNTTMNDLVPNTLSIEEFKLNNPEINPKRVLSNFKWSFGLTAASMLYPYKDRSKLVIGYLGGISAKYRLNTSWSLNGDLLYQQRAGEFTAIKETEETQYKFGKRSTTYRLVPQKMHSIYLPIYVQLRNGKSTVESGIGLEYLIGVSGLRQEEKYLYPWERSIETDPATQLTGEKVWITKDRFNSWNGSLILGYRYSFNRNWNIWARSNYLLGAIFKKETSETTFSYTESNRISIRIGTTFYLF